MRERGLKFDTIKDAENAKLVAPHAGAWIEIQSNTTQTGGSWSLPMRERGLK